MRMNPARYMSDLPLLHGEWALVCMYDPQAMCLISPGFTVNGRLEPESQPSLESKAEVSRRCARALTLSRKLNDRLVSRGGRSREDICGSQRL